MRMMQENMMTDEIGPHHACELLSVSVKELSCLIRRKFRPSIELLAFIEKLKAERTADAA
jgi:hypothetical protein